MTPPNDPNFPAATTSVTGTILGTDAAPVAPAPTDSLIEEWFKKHFMGLGARLDVEMYNIAHAAKEDLKKLLDRRRS